MNYSVEYTGRFMKSLRRCLKRGLDAGEFKTVLDLLQQTGTLPSQYHPHKLSGNFAGCWECHIKPDWLLVWRQDDTKLILLLIDTGTHSDIFGK